MENMDENTNPNKNTVIGANDVLQQLEDEIIIVEDASKSKHSSPLSASFPDRLSALLNSLQTILSRDDAERLLSIGKLQVLFRSSVHPPSIFLYSFNQLTKVDTFFGGENEQTRCLILECS